MDQHIETPVVADEPKRGRLIASYLVRIILREPDTEDGAVGSLWPTNADVVQAVKDAIEYADAGVVTVTSERLDT